MLVKFEGKSTKNIEKTNGKWRFLRTFAHIFCKIMKKLYILLCGATAALLMTACQGGKTAAADAEAGDTLEMKYAKLLTIVKHGDGEESSDAAEGVDYQYTEAIIANPGRRERCCIATS